MLTRKQAMPAIEMTSLLRFEFRPRTRSKTRDQTARSRAGSAPKRALIRVHYQIVKEQAGVARECHTGDSANNTELIQIVNTAGGKNLAVFQLARLRPRQQKMSFAGAAQRRRPKRTGHGRFGPLAETDCPLTGASAPLPGLAASVVS